MFFNRWFTKFTNFLSQRSVQGQINADRLSGKKILVFHLASAGQVQFVLPVFKEIVRRQLELSIYVAMDYPMADKVKDICPDADYCFPVGIMPDLQGIDIILKTEIYSPGPKDAIKVFVGHGQPNKHTAWPVSDLKNLDAYFLYGPLEREMFEVIQEQEREATEHIRLINVGYPKLDGQIRGRYKREDVLADLGLDAGFKTVIYAPAWDPGCSLRVHGVEIARQLLSIPDINVIVKLHPASLEPINSPYFEFYTGGKQWQQEFGQLSDNPRFKYVDKQLINPLLVACDVLITDFSGVALEFMTLDRPVVYIDCPEFYEKTLKGWGNDPEIAKNDDRFNAGRNYGTIVQTLDQLPDVICEALNDPMRLSAKRKSFVRRFLYNPGYGTEAAVDAIQELLDRRSDVMQKG